MKPERTKVVMQGDINPIVNTSINESREAIYREGSPSPAPSGQFLATSDDNPNSSPGGFKRNSDTQLLMRDQSAKTSKCGSPSQVERKNRKSFNTGRAD